MLFHLRTRDGGGQRAGGREGQRRRAAAAAAARAARAAATAATAAAAARHSGEATSACTSAKEEALHVPQCKPKVLIKDHHPCTHTRPTETAKWTPSFPCTRSLYIKTAVHQTAHDAYIKTIGITQSAAVIYTFISMGQTRSAHSVIRVQHPPPARTHTAGNKRQHTGKHSRASGGNELGYWYCREKCMENGRIRIEIGHDDRVPDGQGSCRRTKSSSSSSRSRCSSPSSA